jgi:Ca2+:H+ antiporter
MPKKDLILLYMLIFIPISLIAKWLNFNPVLVFVASGLAIVPLAAAIAKRVFEKF